MEGFDAPLARPQLTVCLRWRRPFRNRLPDGRCRSTHGQRGRSGCGARDWNFSGRGACSFRQRGGVRTAPAPSGSIERRGLSRRRSCRGILLGTRMLSPHRIDGHRYVDGGVRSMMSADRCEAADHPLVITPKAGSMFGPAGRLMEQIMVREMRSWGSRIPRVTSGSYAPTLRLLRWLGGLISCSTAVGQWPATRLRTSRGERSDSSGWTATDRYWG